MVESYTPKEFIPVETSIHVFQAESSWNQLATNEKLYAYYMARAAWEGSKISWFQRSYESPALFVLLKLVFCQGIDTLKERATKDGVSETEWRQFLAYSAAVFQNCGNFKSFGDTKFVPELSMEQFLAVVKSSQAYVDKTHEIELILSRTLAEIYSEEKPLA